MKKKAIKVSCPICPRKPSEPKAPDEFVYFNTKLYIGDAHTLKEIEKCLPAGIMLGDLVFEGQYFDNGYDSDYAVQIAYKNKIKNTRYKSEFNTFEKLKAAYPAKLAQYELDMVQYHKDVEEWTLLQAKAELRKAKLKLSQLTTKNLK